MVEVLKRGLSKASGFWAFRSAAMGLIASATDYSLLLIGVELLHLPAGPCTFVGVSAGACVGFLLNKYVAFKEQTGRFGTQAVKYVLVLGAEVALHSALAWTLREQLGVPYLWAKIACDLTVLNLLHLYMLRHVVFPAPKPAPELVPVAVPVRR